MTLTELKAMIEAEALQRQSATGGFTLEAVQAWLGQGAAPPPGVLPTVPPAPSPLTWRYFSDLQGRDFVTACYGELLGRAPDTHGMEHCMRLLARGEDKAFIAGRIAYSPEGRGRGVAVQGMRARYLVALAKKVPVAGTIFAWLVALATLHRQQRHARAFEQHVASRLDALGTYAAQSAQQVAIRVDALRAVLESRD
jgi:hypothetical protein